ncbi:hypothetical protein GCM10011608_44760 [Micromonospora sonchi]|uniref:Cupin domain-containing protein n=1 Tax=Micromonospora sonchi TaxID=1763543 RepID=A0A917U385_9ACTN|nr:hypothetical protein [Micromonospora sonchi]GGM54908.1 hypothetical protein GCM10011608_44760 [Micromonospora sonchi]
MSASASVVDGSSLPWVNGRSVWESMEPAFRENIGSSQEAALDLLSRYHMRNLWLDPETSRRIDHIRTDAGYRDLSEAYHDSVEEAYFMGGEVDLTAEGRFVAGDYFWRPPGWVHSAASPVGFEAILMMEGEDADEGSDRVSRVVRPDEEAGRQARAGDVGTVGPRGYVRRAETRFMVWRPHDDSVTRLGGSGPLRSKVLSENVDTRSASVLVRSVAADWVARPETVDRERFIINVSGAVVVDGRTLAQPSLVRIPAGAGGPQIAVASETELLVKVGGPR